MIQKIFSDSKSFNKNVYKCVRADNNNYIEKNERWYFKIRIAFRIGNTPN